MASNRSFSEIVATIIDRLKLTQPNLDTKPGSVARDLFVDLPADQIARLYKAIAVVSEKQSLATTAGRDLDLLASNFGVSRATGTPAGGVVVFCTNSLASDVSIPTGTTVTARNGVKFKTIGNYLMASSDKNRLAANASRMRKSLNIAGISSKYAIEVPVQAMRSGTTGNVASLQIIDSNLSSNASVTNLLALSGGTNRETDVSFRSRILSVFSGANIGTSAGYRNTLLGVEGVLDALVVEPGSSLMLRDGTETIETEDGSYRILNSGTGGKVDVYILGRKVQQVAESYLFTDLSGTGNISDERNDHVIGQSGQDPTRTSEERRVLSFKTGSLPAQPVDSLVTVSGSSSGLLKESYTDSDGKIVGNYKLEKDLNPETGGSPFGFDKISFVSNTKTVEAEGVIKKGSNSIDPLSFSDISSVYNVYRDINEIGENSTVSTAGSNYIQLNHYPVVKVSRVQNLTTGEVYVVASQGVDSETGLNEDGLIEITGRSMPTPADVLSVNYTWRSVYDEYIDYGNSSSLSQFRDPSAVDAIDWTSSGGIFEEESVITRDSSEIEFNVEVDYRISKVLSVYKKEIASGAISMIPTSDTTTAAGIELSVIEDEVSNIISITRDSDGLELYSTKAADGSFSSRTIFLPSDAVASVDDAVTVYYNKIELYDLERTDGSYSNKTITLPSESVMETEEINEIVDEMYFGSEVVYVKYVADIESLHPSIELSNLPITGGTSTNGLLGRSATDLSGTNQPLFFKFDSSGGISGISRFGATQLSVSIAGISSAGKIKITGTTLNRYVFDISEGTSMEGLVVNLESELKEVLGIDSIPDTIGIARVDKVCTLDEYSDPDEEYDILGYSISKDTYDKGSCTVDTSIDGFKFELPSTPTNSAISTSSGTKLRVSVLVFNEEAFEELYFSSSSKKVTTNRFGRIDRVSVTSGFRSPSGNIRGQIFINPTNQPGVGDTYFADYMFLSPKEGERITITYNVNRLITDSTIQIEAVRPITADVLIKEAEEITVDVTGTILINDDALSETETILQNVSNAVSNILSTSTLGSVVDYSDIISTAAGVSGVDSVNISLFNKTGLTGRKAFIKALDNQTISPGTVLFEAVSREDFRIN